MAIVCSGNCFECPFDDCVLEDDMLLSEDLKKDSDFIDSILFSAGEVPSVPSYEMYPVIPSEDIPYNPNWKSQAKWREYYRSKMRGNRREYINYKRRLYRKEHKDKIRARERAYYEKNKDKIRARERAYYEKNKDKISAYKRAYFQEHKAEYAERSRRYYMNRKGV